MCVAGNSGCRGQPAVPDGGELVASLLDRLEAVSLLLYVLSKLGVTYHGNAK